MRPLRLTAAGYRSFGTRLVHKFQRIAEEIRFPFAEVGHCIAFYCAVSRRLRYLPKTVAEHKRDCVSFACYGGCYIEFLIENAVVIFGPSLVYRSLSNALPIDISMVMAQANDSQRSPRDGYGVELSSENGRGLVVYAFQPPRVYRRRSEFSNLAVIRSPRRI